MNQRSIAPTSFSDFKSDDGSALVEWTIWDGLQPYDEMLGAMEDRAKAIANGEGNECVWLLEHPALYTAGTSAKDSDLIDPLRFPVFKTGRGGEFTYHGPGQRVAYVMLDLKTRQSDVRKFVFALEEWLIATCARFNVKAERRAERVGVWVERPQKPRLFDGSMSEDKIAALGIRLRKWVSFHGISLNINPDLSHFDGIVPCGIQDYGVTSFEDLGLLISMNDVDIALRSAFEEIFGPTETAAPIQTP